jgi:hypothetical protein
VDGLVQRAVDSLLDGGQFVWDLTRPDPGSEPGVQEIFLSVGTRDAALPPHPRMLSWKLPQWRHESLRSTTQAVLRSADALDGLKVPIRLRAHEPTIDTVAAAIFVAYRVQHHAWPEGHPALAEYVSLWEQGITESAGAYDRALASVFYASMHGTKIEGNGPSRELLTLVGEALSRKLDLPGLARLPEELISKRVQRRLKADADLYRTELSRGQQVQLDLPLDSTAATWRRIDALFLSSPQDVTVLKLLARPDAEASSYRRGFELMAVHAPNETHAYARHTVSLAPESPGTLSDLAQVLDGAEGPSKPDGTPREKGKPRFSFQPEALGGLSDPWYSDGYAWAKGRSTIVAPPFVGTRLSREEIWESIWSRFHVGRHVHVASSRTVYARPFRVLDREAARGLESKGWKRSALQKAHVGLLPSVVASFHGGDVIHLEKPGGARTVHLSLYPSDLALVWVEQTSGAATLYELSKLQSQLATSDTLMRLPEVAELAGWLDSVGHDRWLVYGAYRVNRAKSTMLDESRSVQGLFHAVASGAPPTLDHLPSASAVASRKVLKLNDVEHWFTATGGARLELLLQDVQAPPELDRDFALFLLTTGQRYVAFEITRRMAAIERRSRESRWSALRPVSDVRADVMFFTNSLWYARVSDDPDLESRYEGWRQLHDMKETVEALKAQTAEIDEYRKERFESMVSVLVFVFLPITIVCGFFSGAQFTEMPLRAGLPWSTGGWKVFLIYVGFFTMLTFGTLLLGRMLSWRRR